MDPKKLITVLVRLIRKGAWDEAIEVQHRILETDPRNLRALRKLAELYRKRDDALVAAYYLSQVAERQVSYGYFIQAVATYKQVLALDPRLPDTHLRLAQAYQRLGSRSEALACLRRVADHYVTAGDLPHARETLEQMRALDPGDDSLTRELAELSARQGVASQAAGEPGLPPEPLPGGGRGDDEPS